VTAALVVPSALPVLYALAVRSISSHAEPPRVMQASAAPSVRSPRPAPKAAVPAPAASARRGPEPKKPPRVRRSPRMQDDLKGPRWAKR